MFASTPTGGARGTVAGDYAWARQAETEDEAVTRWRTFLSEHQSPGVEYEDGFQANHVSAAQYELARLLYLTGRTEAGDSLLRELSGF